MKLYAIAEHDRGERLKARVKRAYLGKGRTERGGLWGIVDEFNCSLDQAANYANMLGGGYYGEDDIEDRTLHRSRAPQGLFKLLKHFGVPARIIDKLIRFHVEHKKIVDKHRPSPHDAEVMRQLAAGERLAGMVQLPKEEIDGLGYVAIQAHSHDGYQAQPVWYVARPENEDIIDYLSAVLRTERGSGPERPLPALVHGLAFGYKMSDVFNFVRSLDRELVDGICGNVNELPR